MIRVLDTSCYIGSSRHRTYIRILGRIGWGRAGGYSFVSCKILATSDDLLWGHPTSLSYSLISSMSLPRLSSEIGLARGL